eukprot:GHRR01015545.1.p1 GENE.GHRR01015545.1~~GHRR01015545.1.p1  ORF type:complete len:234 (+),score=68.89 GHRR01015545.1:84-704(+)
MIVDPETDKPVRTYSAFEDRPPYKRVRRTRGKHASNCVVPWPAKWKEDPAPNTTVGQMDTAQEIVEEVTYNPAADFTLSVPSAHRHLRELRALRQAAAAEAAQQQQQRQWQQQQRLGLAQSRQLFGSRSSSSSARGYCTTEDAAEASAQSQNVLEACIITNNAGSVPVWQRRRQCSISICSLLCSKRSMYSSWCGLAAVPVFLQKY